MHVKVVLLIWILTCFSRYPIMKIQLDNLISIMELVYNKYFYFLLYMLYYNIKLLQKIIL